MTKRRILIIENSIDVTGALKSITRTAYDLKDFYDFYFILPRKSKGRFWIERKGFDAIHELQMEEISKRISALVLYIPSLVRNTFRLRRIIRRERISIIHVNDLYNLLPACLWLIGVKTPYVCHIRFMPNKFPPVLFNFWLKVHLRYANTIIAVSQSVLNLIPKHPKLVLIHNELPIEERHPKLIPPDPVKENRTFLYLSNFMRGKGQNFALEAFSAVHARLPGWKMKFVGGDMGLKKNMEYRNDLLARAAKLGLANKIDWRGFTEDVELEYKQADVVLNFSESESFSITCLEAMFFGRPVIATACGGPSEIIDHMKSGILVPNRDVISMSDAMLSLALDAELRNNLGSEATTSVRDKFSVENTSLKLKHTYDTI